jgi:hypothetical protein
MNTEERDRFIAEKLNEGLSLSEVQKLLDSELGIRMTYLDLRLIAADLEVNWKKQDAETEKSVPEDIDLSKPEEPASGTTVTVSKLVRPGAAMSGDVHFASGAEAEWFVDNMGRLGLNPKSGSGNPTREDLEEFQAELQRKLTGQQ